MADHRGDGRRLEGAEAGVLACREHVTLFLHQVLLRLAYEVPLLKLIHSRVELQEGGLGVLEQFIERRFSSFRLHPAAEENLDVLDLAVLGLNCVLEILDTVFTIHEEPALAALGQVDHDTS